MASIVSARLTDTVGEKLERLSRAIKQPKSLIVAEAVQAYLENQEWQIAAIQEGLEAAKKGNFATDEEIRNFFSSRGIDAD